MLQKFSCGNWRRLLICEEKWVLHDNKKAGYQWCIPYQLGVRIARPYTQKSTAVMFLDVVQNYAMGTAYSRANYNSTVNKNKLCFEPRSSSLSSRQYQTPSIKLDVCQTKRVGLGTLYSSTLCSADIAPSDHHLFRYLENFMRGSRFTNQDDLQQKSLNFSPTNRRHFTIEKFCCYSHEEECSSKAMMVNLLIKVCFCFQ